MLIVADTHVHLYSCYEPDAVFDNAFRNLDALVEGAAGKPVERALFLVERQGCDFFEKLKTEALPGSGKYAVESTPEDGAVRVRAKRGAGLYVFAGRQIATAERLEVLSLTANVAIDDGGTVGDTIKAVLEAGGIPVLPWALGKWLGKREKVVRSVLHEFSPDRLLIGDSAMRPIGWGEPAVMREAAQKGFKIVAGTDPFPFKGQEKVIGQYGIKLTAEFDAGKPVSEMRRLLTASGSVLSLAGRRDTPFAVVNRMWRL